MEPILALMGIEAGTVATVTATGAGKSLVFRLHGRVDGDGPVVAWRVAIHSSEIARFLATVNDAARQHFPDQVPPTR